MKNPLIKVLSFAVAGSLGILSCAAYASSLTTLYSFPSSIEASSLTEVSGLFYGTSGTGFGGVFEVSPTGEFNQLFSFSGGQVGGWFPDGGLTRGADGNLYGATSETVDYGGSIFSVSPQDVVSTVLQFDPLKYSGPLFYYRNRTGGCPCTPPLLASDGNLYGTTLIGGPRAAGGIFRVTPEGQEDALVFFNGKNGAGATGGLIEDANNELYGTTAGGGKNSEGTIYQISLSGQFKTLYSFPSASNLLAIDGAIPLGGLTIGPDGYLYGIASIGGANGMGTLFKISTSGDYTAIASIPTKTPIGGLVLGTDGNFYASSYNSGVNGTGEIVQITPSGTIKVLYTFTALTEQTGISEPTNADGSGPSALTLGSDGNFYGTTYLGGAAGWGTVFRFTP